MKSTSILGSRSARLEVIAETHRVNQHNHRIKWVTCQCSCGNTKELRRSEFICGGTKSCGCLSHELGNGYKPLEKGLKLNHLTFIQELRPEKIKGKKLKLIVKCLCDCGAEMTTVKKNFLTGATKSCGCLQRKRAKEANIGRHSLAIGEANFNHLFSSYRNSAKKRGLVCSLTAEQAKKLTSAICFYCGSKPKAMVNHIRSNGAYTYNGIDRIDNTKGYVEENCVTCCWTCNRMKGELSQKEFSTHVSKVQGHLSNS